jgi:hypothetical protein
MSWRGRWRRSRRGSWRDDLERVPQKKLSPGEESVKSIQRVEASHDSLPTSPSPPPPPKQLIQLSCGHRYEVRPGQPCPPASLCLLCRRDALRAQGGVRASVPLSPEPESDTFDVDAIGGMVASVEADNAGRVIIDQSGMGLRPARSVRDFPRRSLGIWARKQDARRARGEVLPNTEEEKEALRQIELRRLEAEREEYLNAAEPSERAWRAENRYRRARGLRALPPQWEPHPARAGD